MAMQLDPKRYDVAIKQIQKDLSEKEVIIKTQTRVITETQEDLSNYKVINAEEISALVGDFDLVKADIGAFQTTVTENLTAINGEIENLDTEYAKIGDLEAVNARIENIVLGDLSAEYAKIEDLEATNARIDNIVLGDLSAEYAKIEDLEATNAEVENLKADVGDIDTLIFGSASGDTIQASFANAVIAQLGDAQIKSAMIKDISADKITAGDIITNNVKVMSEDGKLLISDETIQISDDTRVRVQIGKDASNDYSISIWDADGNLMFSEGGITDNAIKEAIIRNDMVANNANIAGSKLNISSVFAEMNKDGTETLKATKVHLDDKNQTLEVAFKEMSGDVSSQGTAIGVIQGQITSKIWSQDIKDATEGLATEESVTTLSSQYSAIDQKVDGISSTVASHTTQISNKADGSQVTAVNDRVTEVVTDLNGFKTSVSNTYATKEALSTANTNIEQNAQEIALRAKQSDVTKTLEGYYTKSQTNAAIEASADGIRQSVSKDYVTKDDAGNTYATQKAHTELVTRVDGISGLVEEHTAEISNKADGSTVKAVSDRVTEVVAELGSFQTSVSETYATREGLYDEIANASSQFSQTANEITLGIVAGYTSASDFATYQKKIENALKIDEEGFSFDFIQNTFSGLKNDLKSLGGEIAEQKSYIRLVNGEIEIGKHDSPVTSVYTNNALEFRYNGEMVARFTNEVLEVRNIAVDNQTGFFDQWAIRKGAYINGVGYNLNDVWIGG